MIAQIKRKIVENKIKTVSFDLFDTLIFRNTDSPTALFAQGYHRRCTALQGLQNDAFADLRVAWEKKARQVTRAGDISLEDIYAQAPLTPEQQAQLCQAELNQERSSGQLNSEMLALVSSLSEQGVAVCFISDMYLSAQQIQDCFFHKANWLKEIPLFVSGQVGLTKRSGELFDFVADQLGWDKPYWLHIGDHTIADVQRPEQKHIHSWHVNAGLPHDDIQRLEQQAFGVKDAHYAWRFQAAAFGPEHRHSTAYAIGAYVWGPVFLGFVDWVIDMTEQAGLSKIVCLMREAYLFTPLIKQRLAQRNLGRIKVVDCYASRHATFWPAVDVQAPDWLADLLEQLARIRRLRVADCAQLLGLNLSHYQAHASQRFADFKLQSEYDQFWTECCQRQELVKQDILQQRDYFQRYIKQLGIDDYGQVCVVDFGLGGSIQHYMQRCLKQHAGLNLLLASSARMHRFSHQTLYHAFISHGDTQWRLAEFLARSPDCIESLMLGEQGSTLGYTEQNSEIVPILGKGVTANKSLCEDFKAGVLAYFERVHCHDSEPLEASRLKGILARYLLMPTYPEAQIFTQLRHQDNFGAERDYPIIDQTQCDLIGELGNTEALSRLSQYPKWLETQVHWPQAIVSLTQANYFLQQLNLTASMTQQQAKALLNAVNAHGWKVFSVYGAGQFFVEFAALIANTDIQIEHVIDRQANTRTHTEDGRFALTTLSSALSQGARRIVICSFAYKQEIAKQINTQAQQMAIEHLELMSL